MKKYIQVYNYYKKLIETKQLKQGDRLPSVRTATQILSVSKTTIQNAYFALQADGYVVASPKSGYYVTEQKEIVQKFNDSKAEDNKILFDFKSGGADTDSFDIKLWQRYIKSALRQHERLLTYGDVQGEYDLRLALSEYIRAKRNVTASPNRIVVGAGIQSLLSILCSLISQRDTVSFPNKSFVRGMTLFSDYGFKVKTRDKDSKIIYVSPSHMTSYGDVMPLKRRIEMTKYTEKHNSLIIEDDFDSDFIYQNKSIPSLYALTGCDNVVYIGSFSNVLIPGIRISFMVLTQELSDKFSANKHKYSQTSSKTEQIALCQYIRDGHINAQTRKVKKHYTTKAKQLYDYLKQELPSAEVNLSDNGLQVLLKCKFNKTINIFESNNISLNVVSYENNVLKISLTPSAVRNEDLHKGAEILASILK